MVESPKRRQLLRYSQENQFQLPLWIIMDLLFMALVTSLFLVDLSEQRRPICGESGSPGANRLRYLHGNALVDHLDCIGPHHKPYPRLEIEQLVQNLNLVARSLSGQFRQARMMMPSESTMDKVLDMKQMLLQSYEASNHLMSFEDTVLRQKRAADDPKNATKLDGADKTNQTEANPEVEAVSCDPKNMAPARLCKSSFNTTAPLYGVSLTSGEPVTIVQKFPDLLQQVVYETCDSEECDVVHGKCVQTYVPQLFLVIPLGPVTLTGQDYVLVESGCACKPRYAARNDPDPLSVVPNFA